MCQLDLKLVTYLYTMLEGESSYFQMSKAQLKRDIVQLSHNLYNIDLQIQNLRSQENQEQEIRGFETARLQAQKDMVEKEIALELKNAQSKRGRQC